MNKQIVSGLAVVGLVLSASLFSSNADAAGWSSVRKITEIRLFNADGGATVNVDGGALSTTCNYKNSFRVTNETVIRGLVAAYLAGRPIKVRTMDRCDAGNATTGNYDNASEITF